MAKERKPSKENLSQAEARKRFEDLSEEHANRARKFVRLKLGAALRLRVGSDDVLQEALLEASEAFLSSAGLASMEREN